MVLKWQRPILIGGLGLSFSLWMLQNLYHSIIQIGEYSLLSLIAVGGGLWLLKKNRAQDSSTLLHNMPVDRVTAENAIAQAKAVVNQLASEAENHQPKHVETLHVTSLQQEIAQLTNELDRHEINLAVTGGKSVGKTTLIKALESSWHQEIQPNVEKLYVTSLHFHETAPLFTLGGENSDAAALLQANQSDLVLFVTNSDLTDSELQALQQLQAANQSLMLVFNKQDQYLPDERASILFSLSQRAPVKIVATAAAPIAIKVRKHQKDGSVEEWLQAPASDIQQLTQQLGETLAQQGQQLVWATTMRKAYQLKTEAKNLLNHIRSERAHPVIEQYQWIAAAAAFANPVPALDILATAAINAQMVMDLGGIYQQKFSLEQAQTVAGTMGSLMLKLGLVELSSKAIGTVLKSNAVTFVAGGVVQGVSAAYLTRIAGLSLVEYFQQQEVATNSGTSLNLNKLSQTVQKVFQQNQQIGLLQSFVKQGVNRLMPEASPSKISTAETVA
jgi:GTPase SAR1 family protein